jgi:hypothetical protein
MALVEQDSELWQLCKELEELGGGISTKLEPVSLLNLTRSDEHDPPYVKHCDGTASNLTI